MNATYWFNFENYRSTCKKKLWREFLKPLTFFHTPNREDEGGAGHWMVLNFEKINMFVNTHT